MPRGLWLMPYTIPDRRATYRAGNTRFPFCGRRRSTGHAIHRQVSRGKNRFLHALYCLIRGCEKRALDRRETAFQVSLLNDRGMKIARLASACMIARSSNALSRLERGRDSWVCYGDCFIGKLSSSFTALAGGRFCRRGWPLWKTMLR